MSEDSVVENGAEDEPTLHEAVADATETLALVIEADVDTALTSFEEETSDIIAFSVCLRAAVRHMTRLRVAHDASSEDVTGVSRVAIRAGFADAMRDIPITRDTADMKAALDSGADVMADLLEDCIAAYLGGPQNDQ